MKPFIRSGEHIIETCLSVGDEDFDRVDVCYEIQPPEPDVGVAGGIEINSVYVGSRDLLAEMSEAEQELLGVEIAESLSQW